MVLGSLLQELLAPGLPLLLQAALALQLLELQVLKLLGLGFQGLSVLKEAQQRSDDGQSLQARLTLAWRSTENVLLLQPRIPGLIPGLEVLT